MSQPVPAGILEDLRRAQSPGGRAQLGCCVIEGLRLHERALRAGCVLRAVIATPEFLESDDVRADALVTALFEAGCQPFAVSAEVLAGFTGGRGGGEVVGLLEIPKPPSLEELAATGGVLLAAVDVEDPGNVGALSRTALASGAAGFLTCGVSDPWHPKALRTSMGSLFKIPVLEIPDAGELIAQLARAGVHTLAAVSAQGTPLPQVARGEGTRCVLMGSEAFGLAEGVAAAASERVTIPMNSEADSYSVNAAAAVILYELLGRS